jgi:ComF family protein
VVDTASPESGRFGLFRRRAEDGIRQLAGGLASILLPAPCALCSEILGEANRIPICRACLEQLTPWNSPQCARCGRPFVSAASVTGVERPLCHGCRRGVYDFDFARSYGAYSSAMARAIVMLKYEKVTPLAGWFADRLICLLRENPVEFQCDVIVPVPLHGARQRERGYNQADLLARAAAARLRVPCNSRLLVRTKARPEKMRLTVRERWHSVRNAFELSRGAQVDKLRVLLLDDVVTTGATLDACSRALREGGAAHISAITVARAMPRSQGLDLQPGV